MSLLDVMLTTRLLDLTPQSYDPESRTVDVVLSRGSPVKRFYGTEKLEISKDAIDLSRLESSGIPLLDSHRKDGISAVLGRVIAAKIEKGALVGTLKFGETEEAIAAEGMVARDEVSAVSIGYLTEPEAWQIFDKDGHEVAATSARWNENDLTFVASRWTLVECSLCAVPADPAATMRNFDRAVVSALPPEIEAIRTRMAVRHQIATGLLGIDHRSFASAVAPSIFDMRRLQAEHLPEHPSRLTFYE